MPSQVIAQHGAVSREVAVAMAEGIRVKCKATLGVSITGVAGPTGGSEEKPVGLVYHALADGKKTEVVKRDFPGDRDRIRWYASQQAYLQPDVATIDSARSAATTANILFAVGGALIAAGLVTAFVF